MSSDDEFDDDEFTQQFFAKRVQQWQQQSATNVDELEATLFNYIREFLTTKTNYVLIGGQAVLLYLDLDKIEKHLIPIIQSFDYDLKVIGSDRDRNQFVEEMHAFLSSNMKHYPHIKFTARLIEAHDVVQFGYELFNTTKYVADFHKTSKFKDIVRIDGINYPTVTWVLQELIDTMHTESELKSYKRYSRKNALEEALKDYSLLNKKLLKELCQRCDNGHNISFILGEGASCNKVKRWCQFDRI